MKTSTIIVFVALAMLMISFQETECFTAGGIVTKRGLAGDAKVELCKRVIMRCSKVLEEEKTAVTRQIEELERLEA